MALYATVYFDKWIAVTGMKAISEPERRKLACALLDYATFGAEPDNLGNAARSMFDVIKTSLGSRNLEQKRHRGGQPGNKNAEKTNKTNTENEYKKRIGKTNTENELVTSDVQSLTETETKTDSVVPEIPPVKVSLESTQEKEKAYAKEKVQNLHSLSACPECGKELIDKNDYKICKDCSLIYSFDSSGSIVSERLATGPISLGGRR